MRSTVREDGKHPAEEADGGLHNGENFLAKENMEELADTLLEDDAANGAISRSRINDKGFRDLLLSLNAKQKEAFDIVVMYTTELHNHHMGKKYTFTYSSQEELDQANHM